MVSKKTLISIVPYLFRNSGHDCIYHTVFQEVAADLDLGFQAVIPKTTGGTEIPHGWEKGLSNKGKTPFSRFFFKWIDFCKVLLFRGKGRRIFFLESFYETDLNALAFAALFFARKGDAFWVLFRHCRYIISTPMSSIFLSMLNWRVNLVPLVDSELVAPIIEKVLKKRATVVPIPHTDYEKERIEPNPKVFCLWHGRAFAEKGKAAIKKLVTLKDPAMTEFELAFSYEFIFSLHLKFSLESSKESEHHALTFYGLDTDLSREEYLEWLHRSDIVLLPYEPDSYQFRTSGILVEAIVAGKMPVVKDGSWLAYELKKHDLIELIVDWDNPHFFSHLQMLLKNTAVRNKLKMMQKSYAAFHSKEGLKDTLKEVLSLS